MPRTDPLPADVLAALQRGDFLEAIKLMRAAKGVGLTEAKDLVSGHVGSSSSKPVTSALRSNEVSPLSPGEVPRSNKDIWFLLLLVAAFCVTYYFFAH
jgi:hypothetical protein